MGGLGWWEGWRGGGGIDMDGWLEIVCVNVLGVYLFYGVLVVDGIVINVICVVCLERFGLFILYVFFWYVIVLF